MSNPSKTIKYDPGSLRKCLACGHARTHSAQGAHYCTGCLEGDNRLWKACTEWQRLEMDLRSQLVLFEASIHSLQEENKRLRKQIGNNLVLDDGRELLQN